MDTINAALEQQKESILNPEPKPQRHWYWDGQERPANKPPEPEPDGPSEAEVDAAIKRGGTRVQVQREYALKKHPPGWLSRIFKRRESAEAELARVKAEEQAAFDVAAQHESLVLAAEKAKRNLGTLKALRADLSLDVRDGVTHRVSVLLDGLPAVANGTYAALSVAKEKLADIEAGLPIHERTVTVAESELREFEKRYGI